MYGSETWAVTEVDMKRLGTWERKILRRTHGPVVEQGIWRVRNDQKMRKLYKDVDIVADIKNKSLEWVGHVARMDQGRTVKKIFESKPERCRSGRPSSGWLEGVEKDLREIRDKIWRPKGVDRDEGELVIKEAKTPRGP
jgi:hypothetical protein